MDDEPPPFWLQSTTTLHHVNHQRHRHRQRHRDVSSFFLNTGVLITFLLITAILFLVILIPYLVSHAKQVFNPHFVKSSWNSLNIILVLFAILCGFLSRKDDDQTSTPLSTPTSSRKDLFKRPELSNQSQWYAYNDRSFENVSRLRRSSSSYPDLRQDSAWLVKDNRLRFHDDTDVESYQFRRSDSLVSSIRSFRKMDEVEDLDQVEVDARIRHESEVKHPSESTNVSPSVTDVISGETGSGNLVDEPETKNQEKGVEMQEAYVPIPPPSPAMSSIYPPASPTSYYWPSPSPPPPPPPPPPRRRKTQAPTPKKETSQTFETIGYGRYKLNNNSSDAPASQPSPPTPEPEPSQFQPPRSRNESGGRKKGGVNVTKDFFTSFYNQSKRKRKPNKRRSYENLETFIDDQESSNVSIHRSKSTPEFPPPSPAPPPPPPPPLPQSVFQTLFSKKTNKPKKRPPVRKPDSVNVIPTPPPPPPPFTMKPWKFAIQGDYVRLESNNNSPRSGYSASEDESISPTSAKNSPAQTRTSTSNANTSRNNTSTQTLFCPSPDVNMKAEDFIAKFRAKLTLEKSDSINLKQGGTGPSRLRPDLS